MSFNEINSWIVDHQALVVSVAVPLLALLVTGIVGHQQSKLSSRNSRYDRENQRASQIAAFRELWINQLRTDLAQVISLSGRQKEGDFVAVTELYSMIASIQMRLNLNEPKACALNDAIHACGAAEDPGELGDAHARIMVTGRDFLKDEWTRVKRELSDVEGKV